MRGSEERSQDQKNRRRWRQLIGKYRDLADQFSYSIRREREETGLFSPWLTKSYQIDAGMCTIDHQEAPRLHRCGGIWSSGQRQQLQNWYQEAGEVEGTELSHRACPPNAWGISGGTSKSKLYGFPLETAVGSLFSRPV